MPIDHQRIHNNGWLQGSFFSEADSAQLLEHAHWHPIPDGQPPLPVGTRLIVVSHSCDVVSPSQLEQYVEVCPAFPLDANETLQQFGFARDPRRLRVPVAIQGQAVLHELRAPLRFALPRARLEELVPDPNVALRAEDLDHFTFWLSARVRRRSFPNALDKRIGTDSHKRIRRALAKVERDVEALLYSLSTETELPPDQAYSLKVVLLARASAVPEKLEALETARDAIEEILSEKNGVTLIAVDLATTEDMNVATFVTYKNWGFEDLSLEAET